MHLAIRKRGNIITVSKTYKHLIRRKKKKREENGCTAYLSISFAHSTVIRKRVTYA